MTPTDSIPACQELGAVHGSGLDAREIGVLRGIIAALAEFTCATPELIVRKLTGVLFTDGEAQDILGPNEKLCNSPGSGASPKEKTV